MRSSVLQFEHRPQSSGELACILRQLDDMARHHEGKAELMRRGLHDRRAAILEALCPSFDAIEDQALDPALVAAIADAEAMAASLRADIEKTRVRYDAAVRRESGPRTG